MKCFAGTAWYGLVRRARRRGWIYRAVLIGPWHGMAAEASDDLAALARERIGSF